VIAIHRIVLDGNLGILEIAYVAASCACVFLEEVAQLLELVVEVLRFFELFEEVLLVLIDDAKTGFFFGFQSLFQLVLLLILILFATDLLSAFARLKIICYNVQFLTSAETFC
jgi:hypothetical protein